jgi:hypothetical protein
MHPFGSRRFRSGASMPMIVREASGQNGIDKLAHGVKLVREFPQHIIPQPFGAYRRRA